jgi:hypothetical protein
LFYLLSSAEELHQITLGNLSAFPSALIRIAQAINNDSQLMHDHEVERFCTLCHGKVKDIYESKELWRDSESIYRKEGVLALSGNTFFPLVPPKPLLRVYKNVPEHLTNLVVHLSAS